jgi:hypothetical protein
MSHADERQQRLLTALSKAAESLSTLVEADRTTAGGGVATLERLLAYAQAIVEQSDGEMITDSAIAAIEAHADAIAADPGTTAASPRAYADAILTGLALLPIARDRAVEQAVRDTAANFQRSATRRLKAIEAEVGDTTAEIRGDLAKLRTEIQATSTASSSDIESHATAFETKVSELETALATQQQRLDVMLDRHSEAFTEKQTERAESFQEEIDSGRESVAELLKESLAEIEEHMTEIRRMEEESSGLVHSIGLGGTAERYGEEATDQKKVADTLRRLTVSLAFGAVLMAIFAVVHHVNDNSAVLAKLGVSAVLGGFATYTAKQSGRHRKREERARNLQLELTAFAPFIEPLDDGWKELERVLMTHKTFGNIAALPDGDSDHQFGVSPILDAIQNRLAARAVADLSKLD